MRFLFSLLAVGLVSCASLNTPSPGWVTSSKKETVCFHKQGGTHRWSSCLELSGDRRFDCQTEILLNQDGVILHEPMSISVFYHDATGESKVLVNEDPLKGELLYCPTVLIRKQ